MATRCAIWGATRVAIALIQRFFPTCYGSEFISRYLDLWGYANHVTLDFSRPVKPTGSGMPERPLVHEPCGRSRKAGGLA
ncbi:hypothetical protein PhaeoP18_03949 (plasmid) [Phaeobacter piscinae]|nr:hypothetical protein PhaeoP14_03710 [Phaeobacter piscinae]AUR38165.1 hypothetical protein PhaeoP18_03949 [Phaeobacter piscinae]